MANISHIICAPPPQMFTFRAKAVKLAYSLLGGHIPHTRTHKHTRTADLQSELHDQLQHHTHTRTHTHTLGLGSGACVEGRGGKVTQEAHIFAHDDANNDHYDDNDDVYRDYEHDVKLAVALITIKRRRRVAAK